MRWRSLARAFQKLARLHVLGGAEWAASQVLSDLALFLCG